MVRVAQAITLDGLPVMAWVILAAHLMHTAPHHRQGVWGSNPWRVAEAVVLWVYLQKQTLITKSALDAELIALSVVVVFFIGGKAGVEALVSLRTGSKPS